MIKLILENEAVEDNNDSTFVKNNADIDKVILKLKELISGKSSIFIFLIDKSKVGVLDELKKECYSILDDTHANYNILKSKEDTIEIDIDHKYNELKLKIFFVSNAISYLMDMEGVVNKGTIPDEVIKNIFETNDVNTNA